MGKKIGIVFNQIKPPFQREMPNYIETLIKKLFPDVHILGYLTELSCFKSSKTIIHLKTIEKWINENLDAQKLLFE